MNVSNFPFKKTALATALAVAMAGCFHDDSSSTTNDTEDPLATVQDDTKYYFVAVDGEGYVNIYKDNGTTASTVGSFKVSNTSGANVTLGEMHFHHGRAFIVIQGGLKSGDTDIGGGIAVVDMKMAIANPADVASFLRIVPLTTAGTGPSRIVHTYQDPDGEHLWLNNDGPSGNPAADSVFVINWHHPDAADLTAYAAEIASSVEEIAVGDGHKKSAFSHGTINNIPVPLRFATHNLSDQTISIIDNSNLADRKVADTVCLNPLVDHDNNAGTPDACPTSQVAAAATANGTPLPSTARRNTPHGMDYSAHSGKFYTGITPGLDIAVAIIDATASAPYTLQKLLVGDPATPAIPAAGYVHASHDGEYVYTAGYKGGSTPQGYFSIIQAVQGGADVVHQVIGLGNLTASSFDISHMEHVHNGVAEVHMKVLVPSGFRAAGQLNDQIAVLDIDHDTGKLAGCETGFCDSTKISSIKVGTTRGEHRNGEITADGMRAVYPNGDCQGTASATASPETKAIIEAADGEDCKTINVIDIMMGTVTKLPTAGRKPSSIGIVSKEDVDGTTSTSGDDHDHVH